jgi:hypothetical protein
MDKKLIAVIGGAILVIGTFLPIASGGGQSVSFMLPGEGVSWEGLVLCACGLLGAILAFIGQAKHSVWFGIIALGLLVWKYMDAKKAMDAMSSQVSGVELPPEIAAQVAAATPSLNMLGWGVLGLGALVLIVGGALAWKGPSAPAA